MTANTLQDIKDAFAANRVLTYVWRGAGPGSSATPVWQTSWYTQTTTTTQPNVVGPDPAAASGTPGAGGEAYTNNTAGMILPDGGSYTKRLFDFTVRDYSGSVGAIKLIDRLVAVGSIAITSTGNKNVNSVALPRYTTGEGVEVYFEIQTAGTTTAPVVSLASYTNQDGTGGRVGATAITFNSVTATKGCLQGPIALQAGDTGVRSVETINVATAAGGSCAINVVLVRTICWNGNASTNARGMPASTRKSPLPFIDFPRIYDGATLQWMRKGASSNSIVEGYVRVVLV